MTNSPFDGTDSPYGPAAGSVPPVATPHAPPPVVTAGSGYGAPPPAAPPAYRPYATAPRAAPRPRNVLGGWSLGLGIAAFVFSGASLASNVLGTILGMTALALGILALVVARDGIRPRGTAIWGICLSALPVLVAVLRFIGDALSSLR